MQKYTPSPAPTVAASRQAVSQHAADLATRLARLRSDLQRTILVAPTPHLPTARLVGTLRYYLDRYGLAIEVLTETALTALLQSHPEVLSGRLARVPASHFASGAPAQIFADRDGLIPALAAAGMWIHLLPRVSDWGIVVDQLAFLAVLERSIILPPVGFEAFAGQPVTGQRRPALLHHPNHPRFVDPWLGMRSQWHGIPLDSEGSAHG